MLSDSSEAVIAVDPHTSSTTDDRVFIAWSDTREGTQVYFASSLDSGASLTSAVRASQQAGGPVPGVSDSPRIAFAGGDTVIIGYDNDADGSNTLRRVRGAVSIDAGLTWQLTDPTLDGEAARPSSRWWLARTGAG